MSEDADPTHYKLTFRSTMDRIGNDPELFAYLQVFRIDGATGKAVMLVNRQGGDLPGVPIGVFAATLKKDQIMALGTASRASNGAKPDRSRAATSQRRPCPWNTRAAPGSSRETSMQ